MTSYMRYLGICCPKNRRLECRSGRRTRPWSCTMAKKSCRPGNLPLLVKHIPFSQTSILGLSIFFFLNRLSIETPADFLVTLFGQISACQMRHSQLHMLEGSGDDHENPTNTSNIFNERRLQYESILSFSFLWTQILSDAKTFATHSLPIHTSLRDHEA